MNEFNDDFRKNVVNSEYVYYEDLWNLQEEDDFYERKEAYYSD